MKSEQLLSEVYDELRRLAAAKLADESEGNTLDSTALVHEAWLKLANASIEWRDRTHFLRTAATAMRRILIDRARARLTVKRGLGIKRADLAGEIAFMREPELLRLDAALGQLAETHPEHARLVELRFFVGMTGDESAEVMGISPATADRMWRYARAWLAVETAE